MDCPVCATALREVETDGVSVGVCSTCAGIWFDQGELARFDEPFEGGKELLGLIGPASSPPHPDTTYHCPTGDGAVMARHYFSVKRSVQVDECPACGGYWLDAGELQRIREEFASDEERDAAAVQLLDELFGERMHADAAEGDEALARARRVANMLKYISPSYYLPGKQDGAAF
jgi:Zn-finger nucleic acid-binding protein